MLTLEEKIGQMMMVGFAGLRPPDYLLDWLASGRIGGIYLFARNIESPAQVKRLLDDCRAAASHPILVGIDQEGGIVARLRDGFTESPGAMALGAARNPQLAEDIAYVMGREMAALGINWTFAPVADIAHQPDNPSVSTRSVGRDKHLVSALISAQIRGFQRAGIAATVKHFPGLGNTVIDTHHALARVSGSLAYLYEEDLLPFREAIRADVACVMITHVMFEALDAELPATLSPRIVSELLRNDLGYAGAICTDCMEMKAITDGFGAGESAVLALLAGIDMPLFSHTRERQEAAYEAVLAAAQSGRIPQERVDQSVSRIQGLKADFNLTDAPPADIVACAEHLALANQAARAGIVSLRQGIPLPIDPASPCVSIVELLSQPVSAAIEANAATAFSTYLSQRLPLARVRLIAPPAAESSSGQDLDQIVRQSDTLILLTRNAHLNEKQLALASALIERAKSVLLVCARNPYDAAALPGADTVICTNGDSLPSLIAAVDAICGDYIPSGELSVDPI